MHNPTRACPVGSFCLSAVGILPFDQSLGPKPNGRPRAMQRASCRQLPLHDKSVDGRQLDRFPLPVLPLLSILCGRRFSRSSPCLPSSWAHMLVHIPVLPSTMLLSPRLGRTRSRALKGGVRSSHSSTAFPSPTVELQLGNRYRD